MKMPQRLRGLSEVMDRYDAVILDLWGVVHNGYRPFPGTIETLTQLKAEGKAIALLSNAPRRSGEVAAQLAQMGIGAEFYDFLLTSGEAVHHALQQELVAQWGPRCYCLGAAEGLLHATGAMAVSAIDTADLVLATGVPGGTLDANRGVLQAAAERGLPFVCANPDRVVYVGADLYLCPGTLADAYQDMGGTVHWFGKPYPSVYETVMARLPSRRVLAVGDGIPTDVKGARASGIDVALVMAGIHRGALFPPDLEEADITAGTPVDDSRLAALLQLEGAEFPFIIHGLAW